MSRLVMRSAGLMGYEALVEELEGTADVLLSEAGILPDWLSDPDSLIPADRAIKLLEISAARLREPCFGLKLAGKQTVAMLGPVGLLVQQCESVREALIELRRYLFIHSQAGVLNIETHPVITTITYQPLIEYEGRAQQIIDLSMAVGFLILKHLSQNKLRLKSAFFSYATPADRSAYRRIFECPLSFAQDSNGVSLDNRELNRALNPDRSHARAFIDHYLQSQEIQARLTIDEQIRAAIRQLLPLGQARLSTVSDMLNVQQRTLQRRLAEKGTRFQILLNEERKALAVRYLTESDTPISQLAELLGFAETAVFTRSFGKWFGVSPTQYMKQQRLRWRYR